jgi:acyl-CoA thioester hydrolase
MPIFEYQRRVRYADTDQFQAAHHSRAYLWFEEARTELLRALGRPYQELENAGIFFPVREAACRYRALARFDMLLDVAIDSIDVRGASLRFEYRVTAQGVPIADGYTLHACVDREGRIQRLPTDVRALFERAKPRESAGR